MYHAISEKWYIFLFNYTFILPPLSHVLNGYHPLRCLTLVLILNFVTNRSLPLAV